MKGELLIQSPDSSNKTLRETPSTMRRDSEGQHRGPACLPDNQSALAVSGPQAFMSYVNVVTERHKV